MRIKLCFSIIRRIWWTTEQGRSREQIIPCHSGLQTLRKTTLSPVYQAQILPNQLKYYQPARPPQSVHRDSFLEHTHKNPYQKDRALTRGPIRTKRARCSLNCRLLAPSDRHQLEPQPLNGHWMGISCRAGRSIHRLFHRQISMRVGDTIFTSPISISTGR